MHNITHARAYTHLINIAAHVENAHRAGRHHDLEGERGLGNLFSNGVPPLAGSKSLSAWPSLQLEQC
eukprot:138751-Pelagomonas_calceolata.AAC.1